MSNCISSGEAAAQAHNVTVTVYSMSLTVALWNVQQTQRATSSDLFRRVVERLALIDDVNGQKLDRLVTDDLVCAVRYDPYVEADSTSRNRQFPSIWQFDRAALEEIVRFIAVVDVQRRDFARL